LQRGVNFATHLGESLDHFISQCRIFGAKAIDQSAESNWVVHAHEGTEDHFADGIILLSLKAAHQPRCAIREMSNLPGGLTPAARIRMLESCP
jgi:hypothetical protein